MKFYCLIQGVQWIYVLVLPENKELICDDDRS
jgi:hypothetical protein